MAISAAVAKLVDAFIGHPKKNQWYKDTFAKYEVRNGGFAFSWSWWAFFFGPFYLFYRKAYLYGVLLFLLEKVLLSLLPSSLFGIFLMIGTAIICPYLIYLRFKEVVKTAKSTAKGTVAQTEHVRIEGGRHTWPIFVLSLFAFFQFVVLMTFYPIMKEAVKLPPEQQQEYIMTEFLKRHSSEFKDVSVEIKKEGDSKNVKIHLQKDEDDASKKIEIEISE